MCLILDANMYGEFLKPDNEDMKPVRKWLNGTGKIAYSPTEKFEYELSSRQSKIRLAFERYKEAGKLKSFDKEEVQNVQDNLQNIRSDDPHVIALAIVAKVKILVAKDGKLEYDFKNHESIKGKIYQNKSHRRLLARDLCP